MAAKGAAAHLGNGGSARQAIETKAPPTTVSEAGCHWLQSLLKHVIQGQAIAALAPTVAGLVQLTISPNRALIWIAGAVPNRFGPGTPTVRLI